VILREFAARGKTVLFATHYLEEADANADRAILMAHGQIVADGPTTEIKARVGRRTIRATLPDVDPAGTERDEALDLRLAVLGDPFGGTIARQRDGKTALGRPAFAENVAIGADDYPGGIFDLAVDRRAAGLGP